MRKNTNLKELRLILDFNESERQGLHFLLREVFRHPHLTTLRLLSKNFDCRLPSSPYTIASSLQNLTIKNFEFDTRDVVLLGNALPKELQTFGLPGTNFDNETANVISHILKKTKISEVEMDENELSPEAILTIVSDLEECSVEKLHLWLPLFSNDQMVDFIASLSKSNNLKRLSIHMIVHDDDTTLALVSKLSLTHLNFVLFAGDDSTCLQIIKLLHHTNCSLEQCNLHEAQDDTHEVHQQEIDRLCGINCRLKHVHQRLTSELNNGKMSPLLPLSLMQSKPDYVYALLRNKPETWQHTVQA